MNIDKKLMDQVRRFRHRRMIESKTEAIETLLRDGLKANRPQRTSVEATEGEDAND